MIIIVDQFFSRTLQSLYPNLKLKYLDGIFKALIFLPTVQAVFILLYFVVIVFGLTGKVSSKINTDMIFVKNFTQLRLLGKYFFSITTLANFHQNSANAFKGNYSFFVCKTSKGT